MTQRVERVPGEITAIREALVLPLLFLTVALGGGFRLVQPAGMRLLPPSLASLLLAMLLLGVMVRGGLLAPQLLMSSRRTSFENVSGAIVLVTLFLASAQVFNTVTPEAGLLQFVFNVFFFVLLWSTLAAAPDRAHLLHSLLVVFGAAFALKYIVLAALYDPEGGITRRVLTALLEGVTLGGLSYLPQGEATGYVAFFTIVLFVIGLLLLPRPVGRTALAVRPAQDLVVLQP